MRALPLLTLASFMEYNAIILFSKYSLPELGSYLYGYIFFLVPFGILLLASKIGLPAFAATLSAAAGAFSLALVAYLAITNQSLYVGPAVLLCFGYFSVIVLLGTCIFRLLRAAVNLAGLRK